MCGCEKQPNEKMPPIRIKWKTDLEKGVVTTNFEVVFISIFLISSLLLSEKRMAKM
jgi:hypothetical protein